MESEELMHFRKNVQYFIWKCLLNLQIQIEMLYMENGSDLSVCFPCVFEIDFCFSGHFEVMGWSLASILYILYLEAVIFKVGLKTFLRYCSKCATEVQEILCETRNNCKYTHTRVLQWYRLYTFCTPKSDFFFYIYPMQNLFCNFSKHFLSPTCFKLVTFFFFIISIGNVSVS